MAINKATEQKINQLQLLEQNAQNLLLQRQQLQMQVGEIDAAVKELATTQAAYRIIGGIMVQAPKDALAKELQEKREIANLRIKALQKQETQTKEKAEKLQQEVLGEMKDG